MFVFLINVYRYSVETDTKYLRGGYIFKVGSKIES